MEDEIRQLALEIIVTLCEVGSVMMRKEAPNYIARLIQQILKMMADIEEDPKWSCADEIIDEDNDK